GGKWEAAAIIDRLDRAWCPAARRRSRPIRTGSASERAGARSQYAVGRHNADRRRARSRDSRKRQRAGRRAFVTGAMVAVWQWCFFASGWREPRRKMGSIVRAIASGTRRHRYALRNYCVALSGRALSLAEAGDSGGDLLTATRAGRRTRSPIM